MPYPTATDDDVAFFEEHGWIAVPDAVDPADLATSRSAARSSSSGKETMAFDWAWEKGQAKDEREFKILQSSPTLVLARAQRRAVPRVGGRVRVRAHGHRARVLVRPVPRQAARSERADPLAPGRGVLGPQPRRPSASPAGCRSTTSIRPTGACTSSTADIATACSSTRASPRCRATCCVCEPDESRAVACPLALGGVTFHHSKTPHMTPANTTDSWRRILTQHLQGRRRRGRGRPLPVEGLRRTRSPASASCRSVDEGDARWLPVATGRGAGGRAR